VSESGKRAVIFLAGLALGQASIIGMLVFTGLLPMQQRERGRELGWIVDVPSMSGVNNEKWANSDARYFYQGGKR